MIRDYKAADKPAILSIWREANALAHPFLSTDVVEKAEAMIRDTFIDMAEIHIAQIFGQPVGFIALLGDEVGGLFLHPDYHGQGLGRALMDKAVEEKGVLKLDVFEDNRIGRRFYERYGFREIRRGTNDFFGHAEIRLRFGD